jgi:hypothetical protein
LILANRTHSGVSVDLHGTRRTFFGFHTSQITTLYLNNLSSVQVIQSTTIFDFMSQAFVREGDDQWLSDIGPSLRALVVFLTRENNGIEVYEQRKYSDDRGREVHVMSNGLSYRKDEKGKWEVV